MTYKVLLIDGMNCLYDRDFKVNQELLDIINSLNLKIILVVNNFREKAKKTLGFEVFSLEEEGIKKDNTLYFKKLIDKYNLKTEEIVYLDHKIENINSALSMDIKSTQFLDNKQVKSFLEALLGTS